MDIICVQFQGLLISSFRSMLDKLLLQQTIIVICKLICAEVELCVSMCVQDFVNSYVLLHIFVLNLMVCMHLVWMVIVNKSSRDMVSVHETLSNRYFLLHYLTLFITLSLSLSLSLSLYSFPLIYDTGLNVFHIC